MRASRVLGVLGAAGLLVVAATAAAPPERIVVVVSVDGLSPDAWRRARTPHLDALAARGSVSEDARTLELSVTLPSHASMVSGVGPDRHGIRFNRTMPGFGKIAVPTLFTWVRAAGGHTGMFVAKRKLGHLAAPADVETFVHPGWGSRRVVEAFLAHLDTHWSRGGAYLVHLPEVDGAGHSHGWMSPEQIRALEAVDVWIGRMVDHVDRSPLRPRVTWILTSDHGGVGRSHGGPSLVERRIPFVLAGAGVRRGARLDAPVGVLDVTPTAAALLGVAVPAGAALEGRVLREALEELPGPAVISGQ